VYVSQYASIVTLNRPGTDLDFPVSIQEAYQEIPVSIPEPPLETFEEIDARQDEWPTRYATKLTEIAS
jgi:hypothetical protein